MFKKPPYYRKSTQSYRVSNGIVRKEIKLLSKPTNLTIKTKDLNRTLEITDLYKIVY